MTQWCGNSRNKMMSATEISWTRAPAPWALWWRRKSWWGARRAMYIRGGERVLQNWCTREEAVVCVLCDVVFILRSIGIPDRTSLCWGWPTLQRVSKHPQCSLRSEVIPIWEQEEKEVWIFLDTGKTLWLHKDVKKRKLGGDGGSTHL